MIASVASWFQIERPGLILLLLIITGCSFLASILIGSSQVGWSELIAVLFAEEFGTARLILLEIRLPRTLLGLMVGFTLGASGAALQGYLRNPLAEPGLIGVSSSASLGAVVMIYTGLSTHFAMALPVGAILAAFISVIILMILAKKGQTMHLILSGIAISSLCSALTSLSLNLAANPYLSLEMMFWLMGSLADRSFEHVKLALPFMLIGWIILFCQARSLDALTLGDDVAHSLGFNLKKVQFLLVLGTALSVGAATAVTGVIGFVGLVVPHLLRPLFQHKPSQLLLASALGGASLVLIADICVRLLSSQTEIKLGVLTSLIGAPFFLYLILKQQKEWQ